MLSLLRIFICSYMTGSRIHSSLIFTFLTPAAKSGELLKKRGKVLLGTLLLTLLPVSLEELASILGYRNKKNRNSNKNSYL